MTRDAEVTLTPFEREVAVALGKERYQQNRRAGVANARIGPQADWKTDRDGVAGELAFCRLVNVYPDFSTEVRAGSPDCTVAGYGVDVKTTDHPSGQLLCTLKQGADDSHAVSIFVLMRGKFPGPYRCCGWSWRADLCRAEHISNLGHGEGYARRSSSLNPARGLVTMHQRELDEHAALPNLPPLPAAHT